MPELQILEPLYFCLEKDVDYLLILQILLKLELVVKLKPNPLQEAVYEERLEQNF